MHLEQKKSPELTNGEIEQLILDQLSRDGSMMKFNEVFDAMPHELSKVQLLAVVAKLIQSGTIVRQGTGDRKRIGLNTNESVIDSISEGTAKQVKHN